MSEQNKCVLCGHVGDDVVYKVICYICGKAAADYACKDGDACAERWEKEKVR